MSCNLPVTEMTSEFEPVTSISLSVIDYSGPWIVVLDLHCCTNCYLPKTQDALRSKCLSILVTIAAVGVLESNFSG